MRHPELTFIGTRITITEKDGSQHIEEICDGSGFNCVKGNNTYVTRYSVFYGWQDATVKHAKNLSTVIRRIEKALNHDMPEHTHVTVTVT